MYDLDHALNGKIRSQQVEEIKRQVQHEHFAAEVKAAQGKHKMISPAHSVLIALINLLTK